MCEDKAYTGRTTVQQSMPNRRPNNTQHFVVVQLSFSAILFMWHELQGVQQCK
jgi:hypothetical protein